MTQRCAQSASLKRKTQSSLHVDISVFAKLAPWSSQNKLLRIVQSAENVSLLASLTFIAVKSFVPLSIPTIKDLETKFSQNSEVMEGAATIE